MKRLSAPVGPAWRICCGQRTKSMDSRPTGELTRRRYRCEKCKSCVTSYEELHDPEAKPVPSLLEQKFNALTPTQRIALSVFLGTINPQNP